MPDWTRYQKCPVCFAELGKACTSLTGFVHNAAVSETAARPHGGRKLRAGASRA